jgi:hypothetical protein
MRAKKLYVEPVETKNLRTQDHIKMKSQPEPCKPVPSCFFLFQLSLIGLQEDHGTTNAH